MVVSGVVHPDRIWANSRAKEGDAVILTKPIGTGILTTALKRGLINQETKTELIRSMSELNKKAAEILEKYSIHACTDVTGFGLIGHLSEVSVASKVNVELFADLIPIFDETVSLAAANIIPGGSTNNLSYFSKFVTWDKNISAVTQIILCDAQTSGGLLFTVPGDEKETLILELGNAGIHSATHIGNCFENGEGLIYVKEAHNTQ
jgi:selenide,water dikinase